MYLYAGVQTGLYGPNGPDGAYLSMATYSTLMAGVLVNGGVRDGRYVPGVLYSPGAGARTAVAPASAKLM